MTPKISLWCAAIIAALASASFAWFVRLPMPFEGFGAIVAAGGAFFGTLALVSWLPNGWLWTEAEQLRNAFQERHGVSAFAAGSALEAITTTHLRANTLREAASGMREDVSDKLRSVADRLDVAAREIFYTPERHSALRAVLVRSELIEDAARAHAKLRKRKQPETEQASRQKLVSAIEVLDAAFDQTDLLAAKGLLAEVEVASDVAETVLKPRHKL